MTLCSTHKYSFVLDGQATIVINPKDNHRHRIQNNTQGFFIAQSADEVKR